MKIFKKMKDGGPESPVDGFFLIEIKSLFSIALLRFADGRREAYHSHAFNAFTWFLMGTMVEESANGSLYLYRRSIIPKLTRREKMHRVRSFGVSWCLTIRGPWCKTWQELDDSKQWVTTLTHGRKVLGVDAWDELEQKS